MDWFRRFFDTDRESTPKSQALEALTLFAHAPNKVPITEFQSGEVDLGKMRSGTVLKILLKNSSEEVVECIYQVVTRSNNEPPNVFQVYRIGKERADQSLTSHDLTPERLFEVHHVDNIIKVGDINPDHLFWECEGAAQMSIQTINLWSPSSLEVHVMAGGIASPQREISRNKPHTEKAPAHIPNLRPSES